MSKTKKERKKKSERLTRNFTSCLFRSSWLNISHFPLFLTWNRELRISISLWNENDLYIKDTLQNALHWVWEVMFNIFNELGQIVFIHLSLHQGSSNSGPQSGSGPWHGSNWTARHNDSGSTICRFYSLKWAACQNNRAVQQTKSTQGHLW